MKKTFFDEIMLSPMKMKNTGGGAQVFSKNIHWILGAYSIVVSVMLVFFMNTFLSSDVSSSSVSSGWLFESGGKGSGVFPRLYPVTIPKSNISVESEFDPFSPLSKINIWDLFVPELSCSDLTRVGNVGDGGKFMCGISFLKEMQTQRKSRTAASSKPVKQAPPCVVYSYGVSTDSSFETDLLRFGLHCEVHAFDPTIGQMHLPNSDGYASRGGSITFHKLGLAATSGASTSFMLVENLFDTMHRLNHSYIDVLKIDVEGAEWEILPHLLKPKSETNAPAFGQLLVELHYVSVPAVFTFFDVLTKHGFVSFSREINLQPCLTGQLPLAVEYSFINPTSFFDENERHTDPPLPVTPAYHKPIKAVIYFLTQKKRTTMMAGALMELYKNFIRQFPHYPVLVFHDDLDDVSQDFLQRSVPRMTLTFISISFTIPANLQSFILPERLPCSPHSSTIGYRHMISFHATLIHQYLMDPSHGYEDIEFLLRLDDDSSFSSPIGYDIFLLMRENDLDFGFVNTVQDDEKCVHGLWNHTHDFIQTHNLVSPKNYKQFMNWKEGLVIYNNFELSRLSIWQTELWKKFISSIERSGGIYLKRWGDAPIHTIYALLGIDKLRMHAFVDIAYRHLPFADQRPSGLPKPKSDPFGLGNKCVYYEQWRCGNSTNSSNSSHIFLPHGPLHPQWSPDILAAPLKQDFPGSKVSSRSAQSISYQKKIIYTFAHSYRTRVLADTIQSIFSNYAKQHSCGFIVFHFATFNDTCIEEVKTLWKSRGMKADVKFIQVASSTTSIEHFQLSTSLSSSCGTRDPELFLASRFLISQAGQTLRNMGYEWYFRIADDSKLSQPVGYDIFDRLNSMGKRYGFLKVVLDNEICLGNLWSSAFALCKNYHQVQCSPFLDKWPTGVVVMTNFEVSHFSVWENEMFRQLNLQYEQSLHNGRDEVYWSDAAIHTVGMLSYLQENEVEWLGDVKYAARMNLKGVSPMRTTKSKHLTSEALPTVSTTSIPELNKLFQPQLFGWLGGDVAASCALPNPKEVSTSESSNGLSNALSSKYIWLFGDSLIGISNSRRRLEAEMISNSVAIVEISPNEVTVAKRIKSVQYFWRPSTSNTVPTSIFSDGDMYSAFSRSQKSSNNFNTGNVKHQGDARFWPFSALSISSFESELKLLVIGQLVQRADSSGVVPDVLSNAMGGLSFVELTSIAGVVSNPHDPPSMWRTSPISLTFSRKYNERFRWLSITTLVNRGKFARYGDYLYIFCSYSGNKRSSVFDGFLFLKKTEYHTLLRIRAKSFVDGDFSSLETLYRDEDSRVVWKGVVNVLDSGKTPLMIFSKPLTEPSFFFDYDKRLFTITYLEIYDSSIGVCRSKVPEGPYDCVHAHGVKSDEGRINYAAKAHPELSAPYDTTNLVVSYISNTVSGPSDLFLENPAKDLYVPLFLTVSELSEERIDVNDTHRHHPSKSRSRKRKSGPKSSYRYN